MPLPKRQPRIPRGFWAMIRLGMIFAALGLLIWTVVSAAFK